MAASKEWTEGEIVEALKSFVSDVSLTPGWEAKRPQYRLWAARQEAAPALSEIYAAFNDWVTAMEVVGAFSHGRPGSTSREETIQSVRNAMNDLGLRMTQKQYEDWARKNNGVGFNLIRRHFETWTNACAFAGAQPGRPAAIKNREEDAIQMIRSVCGDKPLSVRSFDALRGQGVLSARCIARKYGGWPKALKAAGYSRKDIKTVLNTNGPGRLTATQRRSAGRALVLA